MKVSKVVCALLLAAIIVLSTNIVLAGAAAGDKPYAISEYEFVEDERGEYGFETISSSGFADRFRPYGNDTISVGITRSVYWFRFRCPDERSYQLLQLNNSNIDQVDVYLPDGNQFVHKVGGVSRAAKGDVLDNTWVYSLPEYRQGSYVYIRLESTSALRLPIVLWSAEGFISESYIRNLGFGIFYGVLLAMLLVNLFSFLILKDKAYLFYVLYIGFMLNYQLQVHGHLKMMTSLSYPIYNAVFWVNLAALYVSSVLFSYFFLQINRKEYPVWYGVFCLFGGLAILQGLLGMAGVNIPANQIAHGLGIAGPVVFLSLAVVRLRQGFRGARYYLLAWGTLSVGIVIWGLAAYVPGITSSVDFLLLATGAESVLLTFALADRFKSLRLQANHARYYRNLSLTDELTGLYNKRYLEEKLRREVAYAQKNGKPLSLILIDVDHFKNFNDHYGHLEGDRVLSCVGNILLSSNFDDNQLAFRFGGEEFVLLLPEVECDSAVLIAESIRKKVQNEGVNITVSIGVSELDKDDDSEKLFRRTDKALYEAKAAGRNRVMFINRKEGTAGSVVSRAE